MINSMNEKTNTFYLNMTVVISSEDNLKKTLLFTLNSHENLFRFFPKKIDICRAYKYVSLELFRIQISI